MDEESTGWSAAALKALLHANYVYPHRSCRLLPEDLLLGWGRLSLPEDPVDLWGLLVLLKRLA